MPRQTRITLSALLGWAVSAGQVPPADPLAVQAVAAPPVTDPNFLERPGNVPPVLAAARQLGPADAQGPMDRMILALKPSPEAERRLQRRLADLQDSASPSFHQWLTPEQFGAEFGPAPEAIGRVTDWLRSSGFRIEEVAAGRLAVTFSGTVEQVERTFRTPIRSFLLDGKPRQGNVRDPAIPRALADVVEGVVSLHNIPRAAQNLGFAPAPESGHCLTPAAFAAIYNLAPLHREDLDGRGVSIAVVGRTRIPLTDVARFRQKYGLPALAPEVIINGPDPGDLGAGEAGEANLDLQWAGAAAPGAGIRLVVSASTSATDGVDLSAQYIVNHNLAPVMSTSFCQCEPRMGGAEQTFYRNLWAQAAAQGITSVVASGDSGPAGCNGGQEGAGSGRAVSGLASTPYNLAVGGTELDEGSGCYWDGATALGYIPERVWNESASVPGGSGLWATGGGTSSLYPKPGWQVAPGVPGNGSQYQYRCLPDVALVGAWSASTGANVDAVIRQPGSDRTVANGTSMQFQGSARASDPAAPLSYAWDFGDGAAAEGAAASHTYVNPGALPIPNLVTFTARDGTGAQGSDTRNITVLPPPAPGELIVNGGFELGLSGWTARGVAIGDNSPAAPAHQGYQDAWFPADRCAAEVLRQTVRIPAGAAAVRLTYWLHLDTRQTVPRALDVFSVKARGADGRLVVLGSTSNLQAGPGYQQYSLNLNAYRGQRVELSFFASSFAGALGTSFVLDDVSLIAR